MTGLSEAFDRLRLAVSSADGTVSGRIDGQAIRIDLSDDGLELHDEASLAATVARTLNAFGAAFDKAGPMILDKVYADTERPDPAECDPDGNIARYNAETAAIAASGRSDRGHVLMAVEGGEITVDIAPRAIGRCGYDGVLAELNSALSRLTEAIAAAKTEIYGRHFWNGEMESLGSQTH